MNNTYDAEQEESRDLKSFSYILQHILHTDVPIDAYISYLDLKIQHREQILMCNLGEVEHADIFLLNSLKNCDMLFKLKKLGNDVSDQQADHLKNEQNNDASEEQLTRVDTQKMINSIENIQENKVEDTNQCFENNEDKDDSNVSSEMKVNKKEESDYVLKDDEDKENRELDANKTQHFEHLKQNKQHNENMVVCEQSDKENIYQFTEIMRNIEIKSDIAQQLKIQEDSKNPIIDTEKNDSAPESYEKLLVTSSDYTDDQNDVKDCLQMIVEAAIISENSSKDEKSTNAEESTDKKDKMLNCNSNFLTEEHNENDAESIHSEGTEDTSSSVHSDGMNFILKLEKFVDSSLIQDEVPSSSLISYFKIVDIFHDGFTEESLKEAFMFLVECFGEIRETVGKIIFEFFKCLKEVYSMLNSEINGINIDECETSLRDVSYCFHQIMNLVAIDCKDIVKFDYWGIRPISTDQDVTSDQVCLVNFDYNDERRLITSGGHGINCFKQYFQLIDEFKPEELINFAYHKYFSIELIEIMPEIFEKDTTTEANKIMKAFGCIANIADLYQMRLAKLEEIAEWVTVNFPKFQQSLYKFPPSDYAPSEGSYHIEDLLDCSDTKGKCESNDCPDTKDGCEFNSCPSKSNASS